MSLPPRSTSVPRRTQSPRPTMEDLIVEAMSFRNVREGLYSSCTIAMLLTLCFYVVI